MNRYRVSVWKSLNMSGWVEVEAENEDEAYYKVEDMDGGEIEDLAEFEKSCGDIDEYGVNYYVEQVIEPTVSEGLWT